MQKQSITFQPIVESWVRLQVAPSRHRIVKAVILPSLIQIATRSMAWKRVSIRSSRYWRGTATRLDALVGQSRFGQENTRFLMVRMHGISQLPTCAP